MNPVLGHCTCPHCNDQATVHQEKTGRKKAKYYRCQCGTVQIRGETGQRWIEKNTVWIAPDDMAAREVAGAAAAAEARAEVAEVAHKKAAEKAAAIEPPPPPPEPKKRTGFLSAVSAMMDKEIL